MSLVFYYAPQSTATLSHIVLEELGVPYEKHKLDVWKEPSDAKSADYRAINPNGLVPTIVHDGTAIWESAAITLYLGETFGVDKGVWPAPGPRRGEAMKWTVWTNVRLGEVAYRHGRASGRWGDEFPANEQQLGIALRDLQELLTILDQALAGKQFLCGDYTLADAHVNSYCDWLRHSKIDFSKHEHLNAWSKRCAERPAYQRVMASGG